MIQNIRIIPYKNIYKEFVKTMFNETWKQPTNYPYGENFIQISSREVNSTYVAISNDAPVGFCSIWKNSFHPESLYFIIFVEPKYQRKGIGTLLYQHILSINKDYKYLQSSIWKSGNAGEYFLLNKNFRLFRETVEPSLNTFETDTSFIDSADYHKVNSYEIKSLSHVEFDNEYLDFLGLVKDCYREAHLDNPVGDISMETWRRLVETDLIPEGSYIVKSAEKIIAFALLHELDDSSYDLGWRGVHANYDLEMNNITKSLTYKQIEYAKRNNIEYLNAEIDTTDKWSMVMLNELPFKEADKWLTYQNMMY